MKKSKAENCKNDISDNEDRVRPCSELGIIENGSDVVKEKVCRESSDQMEEEENIHSIHNECFMVKDDTEWRNNIITRRQM